MVTHGGCDDNHLPFNFFGPRQAVEETLAAVFVRVHVGPAHYARVRAPGSLAGACSAEQELPRDLLLLLLVRLRNGQIPAEEEQAVKKASRKL